MIKFLEFCHDFSSECSHNQLCVVVFVVYNDVTYCVSEVHNLLEKDALFIVLVYTTTVQQYMHGDKIIYTIKNNIILSNQVQNLRRCHCQTLISTDTLK